LPVPPVQIKKGNFMVPKHLKKATRKWFESVMSHYELEEHHIRLLTLACEAWERAQEARVMLKKRGMVYIDRFNAPKARPEVAIERDASILFARLVRELDLDFESSADMRPPALKSNRC
jgi:phage terminase small subunit